MNIIIASHMDANVIGIMHMCLHTNVAGCVVNMTYEAFVWVYG